MTVTTWLRRSAVTVALLGIGCLAGVTMEQYGSAKRAVQTVSRYDTCCSRIRSELRYLHTVPLVIVPLSRKGSVDRLEPLEQLNLVNIWLDAAKLTQRHASDEPFGKLFSGFAQQAVHFLEGRGVTQNNLAALQNQMAQRTDSTATPQNLTADQKQQLAVLLSMSGTLAGLAVDTLADFEAVSEKQSQPVSYVEVLAAPTKLQPLRYPLGLGLLCLTDPTLMALKPGASSMKCWSSLLLD